MKKVGILTFHYSNNYGAVLQCFSLSQTLENMGYDVEVINFVPERFNLDILHTIGIRRKIFDMNIKDFNILNIIKKVIIKRKYSLEIIKKFNSFRESNLNVSTRVDENTIKSVLKKYDAIIVGSDQVWNPSERRKKEYFLCFDGDYNGIKISYAADSTIKEIDCKYRNNLKKALADFNFISVRNEHSCEFVKSLINRDVPIVADPTILHDFKGFSKVSQNNDKYILAYVLGEEIDGSHKRVIKKIREKYGELPVHFIVITTTNFNFYNCADKVFYNLGPEEWITMFKNAAFIYTDSYHGALFAMKFHVPFLAYYTEAMRATRFIDLGNRYNVKKYIVESVEDVDKKKSLEAIPNFNAIDKLLEKHKKISLEYLEEALG